MRYAKAVSIGIFLGLLVVAVFALGCGVDAVKSTQTDNKDVKVQLLFEHDGCKVYRFWDFGDPVYYVDCRPTSQTSTQWQHMEGKVEHRLESTTAQ